jgi:alpha-beta hydrolase superfamily lysophospholipase
MGGLVAIRCIRRNPGCFKGAVLEAPLIKFPEEINWAEYYLGKLAGKGSIHQKHIINSSVI